MTEMMTNKRDSSANGFRASLSGTSLFDLIQLECNRQADGGVLIRSNDRTGRLFFGGGQIMHATTDSLVGEAALFEILSWSGGEVFPIKTPSPAVRSIQRSWQDLLMEAACAEDEAHRDSLRPTTQGAEVLALHPERQSAVGLRTPDAEEDEIIDPPVAVTLSMPDPHNDTSAIHASVHDYALAAPDGTLQKQHGNGAWMQQTGSYVARLADLVASSLALEGFEQLDASIGAHRLIVKSSPAGLATVRGGVAYSRDELLQGVC